MIGSERVLKFRSAARSHVGATRTLNEDSFVVREDIGLWAVADGVGGHDVGDVASRMLVEALGALDPPRAGKAFLQAVEQSILDANRAMIAYAEKTPGVRSMGSTIVCFIAYRSHFACFWAGDSRCYRMRGDALSRITKDHSLVQQMVDSGDLTPEDARHHPRSNVITRAVGFQADLELDHVRKAIEPGDKFLICSDGLTGMLGDVEIAAILSAAPCEAAADALLAGALGRRARDNVTLIVVEAYE